MHQAKRARGPRWTLETREYTSNRPLPSASLASVLVTSCSLSPSSLSVKSHFSISFILSLRKWSCEPEKKQNPHGLKALNQVDFLYCPFCSMPVFLPRARVSLVRSQHILPESCFRQSRGSPRAASPSHLQQTLCQGMPGRFVSHRAGRLVGSRFHCRPVVKPLDPATLGLEFELELYSSQNTCLCSAVFS